MIKQDVNTKKPCKDCQTPKPLTDFYPSVLTKDKRSKRCKDCQDVINTAKAKQYKKKADDKLLSEFRECQILAVGDYSERAVKFFSKEFKLPSAIIARRLQKLNRMGYYGKYRNIF